MTRWPCRWSRTACSVTGRKAWLGHSPHLTRGFSQMPRTHSFAQTGAYPCRPALALVLSCAYTSSLPRNRLRNNATLSVDDSGAAGSVSAPEQPSRVSALTVSSSPFRASTRLRACLPSASRLASLASSRAIASRSDCSREGRLMTWGRRLHYDRGQRFPAERGAL